MRIIDWSSDVCSSDLMPGGGMAIEFPLTDEHRQILDSLSRLRRTVIGPSAPRWQDGSFPYPNMEKLAEIGVLGMAVPEAYGGSGASVLDTALALEEIYKCCKVTGMAALGEAEIGMGLGRERRCDD